MKSPRPASDRKPPQSDSRDALIRELHQEHGLPLVRIVDIPWTALQYQDGKSLIKLGEEGIEVTNQEAFDAWYKARRILKSRLYKDNGILFCDNEGFCLTMKALEGIVA